MNDSPSRKFSLWIARLAVVLWFGGALCARAQPPDEASVGNTVWEFQATGGILLPRSGLFLAPGGAWYSLAPSAELLQRGGVATYRVTGNITAVLQLGASAGSAIRLFFASSTSGAYEDSRGTGSFRFMRVAAGQEAPLRNISSRASLVGGQSAFAGFVVRGGARREVLVRAVGPSLAPFAVAAPAPTPVLTVWRGDSKVGVNQGWSGASPISQASALAGAFPLLAGSKDSALRLSLPPGEYVAQAEAADAGGEVLIEIYFLY